MRNWLLALTAGCSMGPNTNPGLTDTTSSPVCRPYSSAASSEMILATGYQICSYTHTAARSSNEFVKVGSEICLCVRVRLPLAKQVTLLFLQNSSSDQQLSSLILPSGQSFGLISTATMDDTTTTRWTPAAEAAPSTFVVPVTAGASICSCTLACVMACILKY